MHAALIAGSLAVLTAAPLADAAPAAYHPDHPDTRRLASAEAAAANLTVYRITPQNYTGVTNMDTGDAYGDVFFGLYEFLIPIMCADPKMSPSQTQCRNVPILSIPDFNVYQQSVLEVDSRFGEYNMCNPNPDSGVFECVSPSQEMGGGTIPGCPGARSYEGMCYPGAAAAVQTNSTAASCCAFVKEHHGMIWNYFPNNQTCHLITPTQHMQPTPCSGGFGYLPPPNQPQPQQQCWYNNSAWVQEFASVCSRDNCTCDVISKAAVGKEYLAQTMGGGSSFSPKCMEAVEQKCGRLKANQKACSLCVELSAKPLMASHTCSQQGLGMASESSNHLPPPPPHAFF